MIFRQINVNCVFIKELCIEMLISADTAKRAVIQLQFHQIQWPTINVEILQYYVPILHNRVHFY